MQLFCKIGFCFRRRRLIFFFICKHFTPYCGPILPPEIMIWTKWNLHYTSRGCFHIFSQKEFINLNSVYPIMLLPSLFEISPVVLGKNSKMFIKFIDGRTIAGWSLIRKAHLIFYLRWAKMRKIELFHIDFISDYFV